MQIEPFVTESRPSSAAKVPPFLDGHPCFDGFDAHSLKSMPSEFGSDGSAIWPLLHRVHKCHRNPLLRIKIMPNHCE